MARQMIAYCGIDCAKCPAYRFPRLGEKLHMKGLFQAMLKSGMKRARKRRQPKLAEGQKVEDLYEDLTRDIICDGCATIDARCLKGCLQCPVRCCAMEMGVAHCGRCPKYPCEQLESAWKTSVFKGQRERLEKLDAGRRSV
jgi:hypothetical protein